MTCRLLDCTFEHVPSIDYIITFIRSRQLLIKENLDEVHGESALSFPTVCFWVNEFTRGRTSTTDEQRCVVQKR